MPQKISLHTGLMKLLPLLGVALCLFESTAFPCTTIIVGKKATVDGSIIIARNSDTRSPSRAKHLKIYQPQMDDQSASQSDLKTRFTALPYYDTEASDGMLQVATNDYGVSMSATESITSNERVLAIDPFVPTGVQEANVIKPVMEIAQTALQAIHLIGARIETEGAAEGFGIAVADANEVWYLETASGRRWVAVRVPDDSYLVAANQGRIQRVRFHVDGTFAEGYLGSKDLVSFAKEYGLYQEKAGEFDFRSTFQRIENIDTAQLDNDIRYNYPRISALLEMFSGYSRPVDVLDEFPTFLRPHRLLSVNDVGRALSHFYQGTEFDSFSNPAVQHQIRPVSVFRASNSHITVVKKMDSAYKSIANIQYIALGMPALSLYVPFYVGMSSVPAAYKIGNEQADDESAFWKFRKLQTLVFHDFAKNEAFVREGFAEVSADIAKLQQQMEEQYRLRPDLQLIQTFTDAAVILALNKADQLRAALESQYSGPFDNQFYDEQTEAVFKKYPFPGF